MLNKDSVPDALILTPPEPDHWVLGSGKASERFGAEDINPSEDWTSCRTIDEHQNRFGFETFNCSNYGTIKPWLMAGKFLGYTDFLKDASERYTGVHTGTTPGGNDPHRVGEIIRNECGLVDQQSMPWHDEIDSWDEYYDRRMADSLLPLGKKLLDRFEFGHEWVFAWGNDLLPAVKLELIRKALRRGPVSISVDGNYRKKGKFYTKTKGDRDTHWVTILRIEGDRIVIHDQYSPFTKTLDRNYDCNVAKVYFLKRRDPSTKKSFWDIILDNFMNLWKLS